MSEMRKKGIENVCWVNQTIVFATSGEFVLYWLGTETHRDQLKREKSWVAKAIRRNVVTFTGVE